MKTMLIQKCKTTLILISLLLPFMSIGQISKIRLLYRSSDINNHSNDTLDIKVVRMAFWSDSIVVKLQDKRKLVLAPQSVWGYESDHQIHRYSKGEFIDVRQMDTLIIYSKKRGGKTPHTDYYFSKTMDSKVLNLTWKNFKTQFADNACFLTKVDNGIKWYQDYSYYDDKKGSYKIVEYYKSCSNTAGLN